MAAPRRTHRKRISALRLSSDTTSTLPEYIGWRDVIPPPEYEADEDTDREDDDGGTQVYIPPTPVSPRLHPHPRRTTHRRRTSSPLPQDVFLDSLLERSVHALELSNALLQSSMAPAPAFRAPSPTAPMAVPPPREAWADDLAAIARDVDDLLVSSSLPCTVSPASHRRPPRRPSLDPIASSVSASYSHSYSHPHPHSRSTSSTSTGLRIAPHHRARLVAPAPRALTQFVGSGAADDALIALPSTLGLRAAPSDWRGVPAAPAVSAGLPEPSTPAYAMLSAFVQTPPSRSPSAAGAGRSVSRGRGSPVSRRGSTRTPSVEACGGTPVAASFNTNFNVNAAARSPNPALPAKSNSLSSTSTASTVHPNASTLTLTISHTLPSPAHSPQSSDGGDGDGGEGGGGDGCRAKEARTKLRGILERAPRPAPPPRRRAPQFHPYSPPPTAHTAPSGATASVSRLFSRGGRHSVSERPVVVGIMKPPSALRSAMAGSNSNSAEASGSGGGTTKSEPPTPGPASPGFGFWARATGSRGGSGASTPASAKRISFAQLPESYASSREGSTSGSKSKSSSKSKSAKSRASRSKKGKGREGSEEPEGWLAWLVGASLSSGYGEGERERERERLADHAASSQKNGHADEDEETRRLD
ncbi:hypothetical protein DFH09DRAFT_1369323 [Mycena vulgaris]|nr:hypothetical protein DFH09DRAFT_1369323 [Mycena vulgaris]